MFKTNCMYFVLPDKAIHVYEFNVKKGKKRDLVKYVKDESK